MKVLPKEWRVYEGRDPEVEARRLKRRFQEISRRYEHAKKLRRLFRWLKISLLAAIGSFAFTWAALSLSPWPPMQTLKHLAAFPNCNAARAVGLAPAYKGQPGYWLRHDEDRDGRSCEPWSPYASLSSQ